MIFSLLSAISDRKYDFKSMWMQLQAMEVLDGDKHSLK